MSAFYSGHNLIIAVNIKLKQYNRMAKRFLIIFMLAFGMTMSMNAQFSGDWGEADPDAWFNKEPFFVCMNNSPYYYTNVALMLNNNDLYVLSEPWQSGQMVTLGLGDGVKLDSGDRVSIFINDRIIGTWVCPKSPKYKLPKVHGGGKAAKAILKRAWKYVKKIR